MNASAALSWDDQRDMYGFNIRAHFFDADLADHETDFVRRMLPVFKRARPEVWVCDSNKKRFRAQNLVADPDAVLVHGSGLLCLEFKTQSARSHDRDRWRRQIPTSGMLQCLAASIAVASETKRATVPLLRCHNVLHLLSPSEALVRYMLAQIDAAAAYWKAGAITVASSELGKYCEAYVRKYFLVKTSEDEASSAAGLAEHARMLRR